MELIAGNIFWVLIAAGLLTSTMLAAAVAPALAFRQFFGAALDGALGILVMRAFGLIVGLSGLLLVYAAYDETVRVPVMLFAITGKLGFAALILTGGPSLKSARGTALVDIVISGLFIAYLAGL